jgi:hypothetical protein
MKKDILNAQGEVVNTILLADGADYPLEEGYTLRDHVPAEVVPEPRELTKEEKISKLRGELVDIDLRSIRAIRNNDEPWLIEFEDKARKVRAELAKLLGS